MEATKHGNSIDDICVDDRSTLLLLVNIFCVTFMAYFYLGEPATLLRTHPEVHPVFGRDVLQSL